MDLFSNLDAIIKWLENKAILNCFDAQHKRFMQVEWQLAEKLRIIEQLLKDEHWDELKKFVNEGVR
jgi:hypothetical protein